MAKAIMASEQEIKQQVREFYNKIGWKVVGDGLYQNARYEDLREVSREYIHRCHLRVGRYLRPTGNRLLDAGSGPIQYPEYLEYSKGYRHRVCADLSIIALKSARERIADHGLFVVADVANLPFKSDVFEGVVSLHTIHHLPENEHGRAFEETYRVLAPGSSAVVVNGWKSSTFTRIFDPLIDWSYRLRAFRSRLLGKGQAMAEQPSTLEDQEAARSPEPKSTFVNKHNADALKRELGSRIPLEICVWRTLNVRFLRAFVHERLAGRWFLRLVYSLEEIFPHHLGEHGAYPLIVIRKGKGAN